MARKSPVQGKKRGGVTRPSSPKPKAMDASNLTMITPSTGSTKKAMRKAMAQAAMAKKARMESKNPSMGHKGASVYIPGSKSGERTSALVKAKYSTDARKAALAKNLIASKKAREAAGSGFARMSATADAIKEGFNPAEAARRRRSVDKPGPGKRVGGRGAGRTRTRSFSESKIKRDSRGRFASKGGSSRRK